MQKDRAGRLLCTDCYAAQAPRCCSCRQPILQKIRQVGDEQYHPTCFTCSGCSFPLETSFYKGSVAGKSGNFCQRCHDSQAPRCAGCTRPIQGQSLRVEEALYHQQCFACSSCKRPIEGQYHKSEKHGFLCPTCNDKVHPPEICTGCRQPIRGEYLRSESEVYHADCLKCSFCSASLKGGQFWWKEDRRVCAKCRPRCDFCHAPLDSSGCLRVDEKTFHADCFRCCSCHKKLEGRHYKAGANDYMCSDCQRAVIQEKEEKKSREAVALEERKKQQDAETYCLRWRPDLLPCPRRALQDLGVHTGLPAAGQDVCICYDKVRGFVGFAPVSPEHKEAAVNVSYLATVLRVFQEHQRAPLFSLDPEDPENLGGPFLKKRFEPDWLQGTVVGEILFQADYSLKKLCFGDERLPGFLSVFDEMIGSHVKEEKAARQWFMVRSAEVVVTADGCLVPQVQLGVQARRLARGPHGYVDAPYTDPNDPTARQAAYVSEHFEEVAQRLPVVTELMAVARATVLAVYLRGCGCKCNTELLRRFSSPAVPEAARYSLKIPTLTKERRRTEVANQKEATGSERLVVQVHARRMQGGVDMAVTNIKVQESAHRAAAAEARLLPMFHGPHAAAAPAA